MPNEHVVQKLAGLLSSLKGAHSATRKSASAVKGSARAEFLRRFLNHVIPQGLRIAQSGEVTDIYSNKTGELDIILENGYLPSLPTLGSESGRLYFAEGVSAVIEVKSDLKKQWPEVLKTANLLKDVKRDIRTGIFGFTLRANVTASEEAPHPQYELRTKIPYFAVGYKGWKTSDTLKEKMVKSNGAVNGILQIDIEAFCSDKLFFDTAGNGSLSLLAFLNAIHESAYFLKFPVVDLLNYGMDIQKI